MSMKWSEVIQDERFINATPEEKTTIRDAWFEKRGVQQAIDSGFEVETVRSAFNEKYNYLPITEEQPINEPTPSNAGVVGPEGYQHPLSFAGDVAKGFFRNEPTKQREQTVSDSADLYEGTAIEPYKKPTEEPVRQEVQEGTMMPDEGSFDVEQWEKSQAERKTKVVETAKKLYTSGEAKSAQEALDLAGKKQYRDDVYNTLQAVSMLYSWPASLTQKVAGGLLARATTFGGLEFGHEYAINVISDVLSGQKIDNKEAVKNSIINGLFGAGVGAAVGKNTRAVDEIVLDLTDARKRMDTAVSEQEVVNTANDVIKKGFDKASTEELSILRNFLDEDSALYGRIFGQADEATGKMKDYGLVGEEVAFDLIESVRKTMSDYGLKFDEVLNYGSPKELSEWLLKNRGVKTTDTTTQYAEHLIDAYRNGDNTVMTLWKDARDGGLKSRREELGNYNNADTTDYLSLKAANLEDVIKKDMGDVSIIAKQKAAEKVPTEEEKTLWERLGSTADEWLIETGRSSVGRTRTQQWLDLVDFGIVGKAEARSARLATERITKNATEMLDNLSMKLGKDASANTAGMSMNFTEVFGSKVASAEAQGVAKLLNEVSNSIKNGKAISVAEMAKVNKYLKTTADKRMFQQAIALNQVNSKKPLPPTTLIGRLFNDNFDKASTIGYTIGAGVFGKAMLPILLAGVGGRALYKTISVAQYRSFMKDASRLEALYDKAEKRKPGSGLKFLADWATKRDKAIEFDVALAITAGRFGKMNLFKENEDEE